MNKTDIIEMVKQMFYKVSVIGVHKLKDRKVIKTETGTTLVKT